MKTQNQASLNRIKAFTLVELIVVITILAILGTIAFISFQGYSRSARNSKRISDIANIKTTLALFNTKTGRYPEPDSPKEVTYNTNITIRTQGIVGEQVTRQLEKLGKTPLDPLLETEYAYSVLNTKKEYEVGCIFEGEVTALNSKQIINQTLAEEQKYYAYIKGDYNGKIAKASSGAITYIFAVPSIISSNLGNPDLQEQINNKLFVFNGYQNIPDNYKGRNITMTGGFDFGGYDPLILTYSDNIKDLSGSGGFIKDLGDGLKSIYSGSILASNSNYKEIVELDTSDTTKLNQIIGPIINNNLGGEVKILASTNTIGGITTSRYPGCDTDDISVGKYKVAACNVGSTIAGTTSASYGRLFQWGEMYGRDTDGGTTSGDNIKYVDGVEVTGDSKSSWSDTVTDTTSGGSDRWNGDNSPATQGPCAPGYHVPTNTEWGEIIAELGGDATTFTNTLKVTFAGARVDGGGLQVQGSVGTLWTSTPSGNTANRLLNNNEDVGIQQLNRNYALSVRCLNNQLFEPIEPVQTGTLVVKNYYEISSGVGGFPVVPLSFVGISGRIGDLNNDGIQDISIGAPIDSDGGDNVGAIYNTFLNSNGTVKSYQKISYLTGGLESSITGVRPYFGRFITNIGDLDNNGIEEIAVNAVLGDGSYGAIYILFMNNNGTVNHYQKINQSVGGMSGLAENDRFGSSITSLGDFDGDGIEDIAVGAYGDDDGGTNRGAIYLLFLNSNGTVKSYKKISNTIGGFTGTLINNDYFGGSLSNIGDLDLDGVTDLVVGLSYPTGDWYLHTNKKGALFILFLNADGTVKNYQKIDNIEGGFTGTINDDDNFGKSVSLLGDYNGDGIQDIIVGGGGTKGKVYLLFLNRNGTVKDYREIGSLIGGFKSLTTESNFGFSVSGFGDYDGDGIKDILVSEINITSTGYGKVYIITLNGN